MVYEESLVQKNSVQYFYFSLRNGFKCQSMHLIYHNKYIDIVKNLIIAHYV